MRMDRLTYKIVCASTKTENLCAADPEHMKAAGNKQQTAHHATDERFSPIRKLTGAFKRIALPENDDYISTPRVIPVMPFVEYV